jgi:hypothetical protein
METPLETRRTTGHDDELRPLDGAVVDWADCDCEVCVPPPPDAAMDPRRVELAADAAEVMLTDELHALIGAGVDVVLVTSGVVSGQLVRVNANTVGDPIHLTVATDAGELPVIPWHNVSMVVRGAVK